MRSGVARAACSKSEFHVAREDTKFARNNLKVNYAVKGGIEQRAATRCVSPERGCNVYGEIVEILARARAQHTRTSPLDKFI